MRPTSLPTATRAPARRPRPLPSPTRALCPLPSRHPLPLPSPSLRGGADVSWRPTWRVRGRRYTYSYLQRYLHSLEARQLDCVRRECLCRSVQERRLDCLTISSPVNLALDAAVGRGAEPDPSAPKRHVLFVTARVHPGETPASFVAHGLIAFLTSSHPKAAALRDMAIVKVVPMLNPDGVFLGNYRCSSLGLDLNRMWDAPSPCLSPTLHRVRDLLLTYARHPTCTLNLCVDMHAHSTCMAGFLFSNAPDDPREMDAVSAFPKALSNHSRDFAHTNTKYCNHPSKHGTGRRALADMLPGAHCYTMEVSMYCAANGNQRGEPYTPASYTEMGQAVGLAM